MSRNSIKKVAFSPEADEDKQKTGQGIYRKQGYGGVGTKIGGNKKRVPVILGIRIAKKGSGFPSSSLSSSSSPAAAIRFLKRIGTKVAMALRFMSSRKKSSRKVSSASLARSRSYAETLHDSQRAEAIEDCIEFLNSSSSLQRSNSLASSSGT